MTSSSPASRIQANLQELFKAKLAPGDTYIRFRLTAEITALLPMKQVQESLIIEAEKITPLPNLPESILGMMNSRDRVFCVIDLAQLLEIPSRLIFSRQYQIIVVDIAESIKTEEQKLYLGIAVGEIQGLDRIGANQINSATKIFATGLAPYLQGYVTEKDNLLPVFNLDRLVLAVNQTYSAR